MKNELRELTDAELDLVSGGSRDDHSGLTINFNNDRGSNVGAQVGVNLGLVVGVGTVDLNFGHHHSV